MTANGRLLEARPCGDCRGRVAFTLPDQVLDDAGLNGMNPSESRLSDQTPQLVVGTTNCTHTRRQLT